MAPTPDLRPDPAPAATAAEPAAEPSRWARLGDHPVQTALLTAIATVAVGLLFFSLTTLDNKIEKVDTKIDKVETNLTDKVDTKITELDTKLTARIDKVEVKVDGLDDKVDEINLKLTALIAGLGMTDLVDAAVEGRLPAAEPAGSEPAGAPG